MDNKLKMETLSLVLLLVAFPVISFGSTRGSSVLWWIGLLIFVGGSVLPIWTRFMDHSKDAPRDAGIEFDDRTS